MDRGFCDTATGIFRWDGVEYLRRLLPTDRHYNTAMGKMFSQKLANSGIVLLKHHSE